MKFLSNLCLVPLLLLAAFAFADAGSGATVVTLQVTDADSQTWNNGTYQVSAVKSGTATAPAAITALSGSGAATVSITTGSTARFTVCPDMDTACYKQDVAITGDTQSVTLAPPAIRVKAKTLTATTRAYADAEVTSPVKGTEYFNTVDGARHMYDGSTWGTLSQAGAAVDSNTVHKTGNETAAGNKTFSGSTLTPLSTVTGLFGVTQSESTAVCETSGASTTAHNGTVTITTGLNCLPANAVIDAVLYRLTTAFSGNAISSFTIGDGTIATRFCGTQSTLTLNATGICFAQADQTSTSGPRQASAAAVVVTENQIATAGAIRLIVFYHTWVAPTS
jgi:hypothetical protein